MFTLPDLPYALDALAPHISAQTLALHHGKHHKAYVDKTNALIGDSGIGDSGIGDSGTGAKTLEQIITELARGTRNGALFNNAAQAWNHEFYWPSMGAAGGGRPDGEIARRIDDAFGSYDDFVCQFKAAATELFGSGWVWLILEDGKVRITQTFNADTPIAHGQFPLLTLDVWEHAYYLDQQNRRADYVAAFIEHLVNWDFANFNLSQAVEPRGARRRLG